MKHESDYINVDGIWIDCRAKIIGDHFRYFVKHYEFPFCSIDKPDENGNMVARTLGGRTMILGNDFKHEDVVRWALQIIKENDISYYRTLTKN